VVAITLEGVDACVKGVSGGGGGGGRVDECFEFRVQSLFEHA
jgi:hypothetical protein